MRVVVDSKTILTCLTIEEDNLFNNINAARDQICLSERILKEYSKPPFSGSDFVPQLENFKKHHPSKFLKPALNPRPELRGIPSSHRAFIEEAIRIKASYFITEYLKWRELSKDIWKNYNLKVVTPQEYIRERRHL